MNDIGLKVGQCKEMVWGGWKHYQCSRKEWKDGYCKQHHPDSVKERERKAEQRYQAKKERSPYRQLEKAYERIKELEAEVERLHQDLLLQTLADSDAK